MDRGASILLVVGLVLAVVGASVEALLVPAYTNRMVAHVDSATRADLTTAEAARLAEAVRAYVAGAPGAWLPARLDDGRPAFDQKAVSHLDDVRDVLAGARIATLIAAGVALVTGVWLVVRGQALRLARGLRVAGRILLGAVVLAGLIALADFDRFFAGFHALFFEAGTWQFTADALLIRLFPEPFWVASGVAWGVLVALGGLLGELAGASIERRLRRADA